ncbi:Pentachlorophenol 4-monooxygenase [Posidoniimonas corsicana]|uniref:Pentachlorophenol 4-monooxygenase n=1 Tax=Posidoniimonas corsicana TaxID=1938618 RepID=A0A5C5VFZ5_9BACT|nr:FAD-dependent monooxygenase [Posidoniimonas corsicana]TWT36860.1 Pentachlorophenol 4-monooxygenase [Posidoniimonas corsicana]
MTATEAPVLVVGGRTTGLMMAAELARHGAPVRIIDKSPGIDPHSRATYLHSRTLEILHTLGIADEIVDRGQPLKAVSIHANGRHVVTTPDLPVDSPFPWGAAFAQCKTEAILERHLNNLGIEVERSVELQAFEQSPEGVRAMIRGQGGAEEVVDASYLIGCDGAHSTVRRGVDEAFPGAADPIPYQTADVLIDGPIKPEVAYLCLHDQGDVFIFLLDEGRRQVIATLPKDSPRTEPPTLEEMQRIIDERGFPGLRLSDARWLAIYHTHYRLAPRYRRGRVFLAGDAAHIHSVIGGQGMNTGIQDAHNLAWKLALVMRGVTPSWWLDTYESERRGVAADVIAWTKRANDSLTSFAELSPAERERLLKHMVVPESDRLQVRAHQEEIDLDYRSSRLCVASSDNDPGPAPGARAPDAGPIVVNGESTTLLKRLGAPLHQLLLFGPPDAGAGQPELAAARRAVDAHGDWLRVLLVDANHAPAPNGVVYVSDAAGALRRAYAGDAVRLYLIRPDGYIAYRSRSVDRLDDYVEQVLN